jgi:hypothetical protein
MIARTYYYRYYINTWADADGARGYPHQVRFFYGPDACKEFLTASYKTDALSGLEDREYEYCVDRRPKTLSVKGGCAGCGGGGTGDYAYTWYLGKAIAAAAVNESHVKVSIALANDDVHSSRRVLVFNAFGQKLIDAACVKETEQSAELSWVWAGVYTTLTGGQWCLQDKFWPSACGSFDPNAGTALDCAASGTNPVFSGNGGLSAYSPSSSSGKHALYTYAWSAPCFDLTTSLGQGTGSASLVNLLRMQLLWSGDRMRWVRKQIQAYEADGVTHHDTTYNYTSFHAEDALAFKDVRVDHPIVSTANNGSGATVSEYFWYHKFGVLVWSKNGRDRITYR